MEDRESQLRASVDRNEFRANLSAWLIVAGVVVEIVVAVLNKHLGTTLPDTMIALGIAGELLFAARASRAASDLRAISDERIAELTEKGEQERLARVKIEARLAKRSLSQEQQGVFTSRMSEWAKLPGTDKQQSVSVFPTSGLHEAANLANEIAVALEQAGWAVGRHPVTYLPAGWTIFVTGVGILTSSNPRGIAVAQSIADALNEQGVETTLLPEKRGGCEEQGMTQELIDAAPWCSAVSVLVGDHP